LVYFTTPARCPQQHITADKREIRDFTKLP